MNRAENIHLSVEPFFHKDTGTFTYVVDEGDGGAAVIIDPVLDYDAASACTGTQAVDAVIAHVRARRLRVEWVLETHAHADHLSAGDHLRKVFGAKVAIGRGILEVQARFRNLFGLGDEVASGGGPFDRLLDDGETFKVGTLEVRALATPGHTDDGLTYLIGDAAFIGDTLLAPDIGSARCDFPGGDAARLYRSIRKILALPGNTRVFLCHDYPPQQRGPMSQSSITTQRDDNIHVGNDVSEAEFVAMRRARDAKLSPPRLFLPALQVNLRGGRLPPPAANGIAYLTLPLNQLGAKG